MFYISDLVVAPDLVVEGIPDPDPDPGIEISIIHKQK